MVLKIPPPPPIAKMDPTLNRWFLEVTAILNGATSDLNVLTAPTAPPGTNTDQIATTAFVIQNAGTPGTAVPLMDGIGAVGTSLKYAREDHVHPSDTSKASLASPAFTGTPTAPTAAPLDDSTKIATTAYVDTAVAVVSGEITSGSWTPTLLGSTGAGAPTYTIQVGSYEQVGRTVTARFVIAVTALGGPTGSMEIGGLPFPAANVANDHGGCFITFMSGVTFDAGYTMLTGVVVENTSIVGLRELGSGVAGQAVPVANFAAATSLQGTIIYHV